MNRGTRTKQQLLFEIEELRTRLDLTQQRLKEANERMQAEMTERKRAEEDFVRAQKHAESIVETIRDPLLVLTADLKVISANQSFYRTFEVTPEETEGRFIYSVGDHQWDIPALRKLLEQIVPQNSHFNGFEVDHEFPGIGRKTMLLNARRIYRQGKGTEMILLAVEDITERNQARELLEVSETRYRRLFETAQDGILILDADTGRISDVNPFLMQMLGYSHEDFLGKRLWEIGAFKDIEASQRAFSDLQTRGYVRYEDLPLQTGDGRSIAVEFVSNVYLVDHHKVIQCNIRDITERKRVEEALHESEEMFRLFMDHSPIYVFFKDENVRTIQISKNYEKMLGRPVHELIGKTMNDLFPSELAKSMVEDDLRVLREGRPIEVGEEFNGRFYTTTKFPITRKGRPPFLAGFTVDITERKQGEEEREKLIHELQDALANIKVLRGMLPICASCKKIRDDKGYWNHIEAYIQDHSEVDFTHGICPECVKKLYGVNLDKETESKEQ